MSLPTHLICYKSHYYYQAKVPVDLRKHFCCTFIKKSLKTTDLSEAKTMLVSMEYNVHRGFTLLRTGMLPADIVRQVVEGIVPSRQKADVVRGKLLSDVVKQYVAEKESGWTYKTKLEVVGCLRLIVDVVGSMELKEITKQTVLDFRAKLMKLPANMYKIYPGKTIQVILNMSDVEPMSINSVNKHIMRLNALLSYAVTEGLVIVNYAQGMMISDKRRTDELRKVYSPEDLKVIVDNLPREQGRPERFWIPLIAMYSGMRLDEVCQLYVEDVQQLDGVWCFNINDEKDKKVKSASSKRVVPVHKVLLTCGILEYVGTVRSSGNQRLWVNLSWRKEDGYGNAIGNWYRRFNREHVSKDEGKVFHSFRHTVTNSLKQAGVSEAVIAELVGHSTSGSMTMGRYGKRYQPKVLLEALMKLDYGIKPPVSVLE
ncbi:MAG: site-specific integrase [Desulfuromonadaceae bacterium]|nr:site-specific integrase [Desulfuromonadaceae bacterium]MDD2847639.1 site-specific integrase [Desulfuromonadaceae bacterium]MDD4131115.1 site-specific integrase [Desulfuromonadaceae bacterium]